MAEFSQDPWFLWGPPWHTSLMISLLLGSVLKYNMPLVLQTWQIHHSGAPRGPKAAYKGPGGPLTYQSYDKMCCNEFPYNWDRFWYITCQQTFKLDKFTIQGPPGTPQPLLRNLGSPWHINLIIRWVAMSFPMNFCITGINFYMQYANKPSNFTNSYFRGSQGPHGLF